MLNRLLPSDSDHSQVKIAWLVFDEPETLLSAAEVPADAGGTVRSDWGDCLHEQGFVAVVPSCKCIGNPWPHAVDTSPARA